MGVIPAIISAAAAAYGAYETSQAQKMPKPKTPGAPPSAEEIAEVKTKRKRMPQPAQVFRDEDLRLGQAGTLGG